MAGYYSSGSASSFQDLRDAIQTFLTSHGFSNKAGTTSDKRIVYKSPLFIQLESNTKFLKISGGTSSPSTSLVNPSHEYMVADPDLTPVSFPINYEFYLYPSPDEFYCVINYNGSRYQHLNFGTSNVPSVGGAGTWITASINSDIDLSEMTFMQVFIGSFRNSAQRSIYVESYHGYGLGYFLQPNANLTGNSSTIHCGLEGADSWRIGDSVVGSLAPSASKELLMDLPSLFNEADVLLPISPVLHRVSDTYTIVADLVNVRYCRLDNRAPGDTIVFGSDSWKVYPLFTKSSIDKDGVPWNTGALHSGTIGVAIKVPV